MVVSVTDTAANHCRGDTLHVVPIRATKRGDDRGPLSGSHDVLICGASFAGLAVARELAGSGADVLVVDRYEIGERQTSACGIPTDWLQTTGLMGAERQRFGSLLIHTPHGSRRYELPWTFSTFDYRELCELLWQQCDARFETAKVNGRAAPSNGDGAIAIDTDRGTLSAPLIVDALGWRRVLASSDGFQPPDAPLSRGLEVHPTGSSEDLEVWIDRRYVPAGYGWSFPARDELRIGCWPRTWGRTASAIRATGFPTSFAAPPRAAFSSPATRPATACR
jgi:menaquinone-9 beta-reductase